MASSTLTPATCRAARAGLNWSQADLCTRSQTSITSLTRFERGLNTPHWRTLKAFKEALEAAGVKFVTERQLILP